MVQDVMSSWVQKARQTADSRPHSEDVQVVRREQKLTVKEKVKSQGQAIMDMAEKIWPSLMKMFEGVHDENGMLMQPSHVRGIALNVAQDLVKLGHDDKKSA